MSNFFNKLENIRLTKSFDDVLIKPRFSEILPSESNVSVKLNENLILDIPIFSSAMDTVTGYEMSRSLISLGACGPLNKNIPFDDLLEYVKKLNHEFGKDKPCAVAIGIDVSNEQIEKLVLSGCNIIIIDSAHGHSYNVGKMSEYVKKTYPNVFLIAGNVVTAEGAKFLIDKGVDAVKVGIGSGSICTTRKVTGVGVGQLTAIADVACVCKKHNVLTLADGGIRSTDEIMKAIVAGADLIMLGYMLSGTDECPGETVIIQDEKYKLYRGMGSINAMKDGSAARYNNNETSMNKWIAEGVEGYVKVKGSVKDVMLNILWSLQTSFGYLGARNMQDVHQYAELVEITNSVLHRSKVHSIDKLVDSEKDNIN